MQGAVHSRPDDDAVRVVTSSGVQGEVAKPRPQSNAPAIWGSVGLICAGQA